MPRVTYGDDWNGDKLSRKAEAEFLSKYLIAKSKVENSFSTGGFVLNLNAEWGFGKTYLLKNWADMLSKSGHPVVYFDAWENDFSKEPLVAFISTINEQLTPFLKSQKGKKYLQRWFDNGKKLLTPSVPMLLGLLVKKVTNMSYEEVMELLDLDSSNDNTTNEDNEGVKGAVSTVISNAALTLLKSHKTNKKIIEDFKHSLGRLTSYISSLSSVVLPLFIFIDELDRCRPNYAIETLENIKHLFGVPGVFFVVATASDQLCHSIKNVYGSGFNSEQYLKRFFDQTYSLDTPDRSLFARHLFQQYGLSDRENLFSPLEQFAVESAKVETFAFMANSLGLGLRDMIQYCIIIDSISLTYDRGKLHLPYLMFLIKLKDENRDIFNSISATEEMRIDTTKIGNNMGLTVKTLLKTDHFSARDDSISAKELVNIYINYRIYDYEKINQERNRGAYPVKVAKLKILESLIQDMTAFQYGMIRNPLGLYPKLIEQAGRLE